MKISTLKKISIGTMVVGSGLFLAACSGENPKEDVNEETVVSDGVEETEVENDKTSDEVEDTTTPEDTEDQADVDIEIIEDINEEE